MRVPFDAGHARRLRFVRAAGFLADGRRGFYSLAEVVDDTHDANSLWVFDRDGSAVRRVAEGLGDVGPAAPSPDGTSIAVLAGADGRRQIHLVAVDGDRTRRLTDLPQGVSGSPAWSPDGRSIAFTAGPPERRDPSLPYRIDRETFRFDGIGHLDDAVTDIYVADVETGAVRRLTGDRSMNSDPCWSPDGRALCYLVSFPPDRMWDFLPGLHVLSVETGESRPVVGRWGGVLGADWCADGTRLVFVGCAASDGLFARQKMDLWTVDAAGGEPECRTAGVKTGMGAFVLTDVPVCDELEAVRIRVVGDDAYVSGQAGGDVVVYRVGLTGPERVERAVDEAGGAAYLVDVDAEAGVLHQSTSFVRPPDLMLGSRRITALNDALLATVATPRVRELTVTAPDGLRTQAWALVPPHGDGPWPTVLSIHGGPYSAIGSTYYIDFQLLVGAGFAVVFHNFRGSYGYGGEFSKRISGDWGAAGALDHHAAVDEAIRAGIADRDRIGVCGLSYGGFSTCWLLGTSDRFRAGVAENPVTSWETHFGESDTNWHTSRELGGLPHEVPETYRAGSPLAYAENCRTPLLFIVGEDDLRCTPIESEQYYRVLRARGVPTEMLRLPNCSHIGSYNGPVPARDAQNEALLEWFIRYL